MDFLQRLIDSAHPDKKHKRNLQDHSPEMAFAPSSNQFLSAPSAPHHQRLSRPRDDIDDFLSSDLELSFASTVSLHSPPRDSIALTPDSEDHGVPMDISPAPVRQLVASPSPAVVQRTTGKPVNRPRAFTSAARMFGRDMSNSATESPAMPPLPTATSSSTQNSTKRIQRSALPAEWFAPAHSSQPSQPKEKLVSVPPTIPSSPSGDAMDVDIEPASASSFSPLLHSAAPTITTFTNLFYDTMSPRRSLDSPGHSQPKKRRSASPESTRFLEHEASSSPANSSPSQHKLERMASASLLSKPTLQGLGVPSNNLLKRLRRPVLSATIQPTVAQAIQSAFPVLTTAEVEEEAVPVNGLLPSRRAFSALLPPKGFSDPSSDESSFDGPDMSSPAQAYAKRQQVKTLRRCDGTEDFRPLTGATVLALQDSPSSKFLSTGLPGFGDNEAHGKILPCHRVTDDGLMRINVKTLDNLIDGVYDSQISQYYIIDCRFDYEYNGGHIDGAINIKTAAGVEEMLLGGNSPKPRPSISGDASKKVVLVFHCEFSSRRAPTFAKHLRAKDRAMNNHIYPKIHYPEVYILEGGYCQYFKTSASRCKPSAYVPMDDPTHAVSRREDLDLFRKTKFGRHKSYTYGDGPLKTASISSQPKRNTVPSGPNTLFAAANAARTRRGGAGLSTLAEDGNTTAHSDDEDTDIGDSPCPPPTKAPASKVKKLGRPFGRAETYGPARMTAFC